MDPTLDDVASALSRQPRRQPLADDGRRAAVAAVVTADLDVLFIRRAEYAGDPWSGHVSFPGGRVEAGEDVLSAAIRETSEELSLDLGSATLLGELDEVATMGPLPRLVIRPYVFAVPSLPEVVPNEEVAAVHTLRLSQLLANAGRGSMRHPWRGTDIVLPRVDFDGVRLWGLTLHMVDDLLDRIDGRGRGLARVAHHGRTPWDRG
jgi:8-oxo-dGTP pyrophosphatase MutT (NUDIX family)